MPPLATAVRWIELPWRTTPAGTPEMATLGRAKSTDPRVIGGMVASGGEVTGMGTKPAATRAATSGPVGGPMALPIRVSTPALLKTGPQAAREDADRRGVGGGAVEGDTDRDAEGEDAVDEDVGECRHDALELAGPVEVDLGTPGRPDHGHHRAEADDRSRARGPCQSKL